MVNQTMSKILGIDKPTGKVIEVSAIAFCRHIRVGLRGSAGGTKTSQRDLRKSKSLHRLSIIGPSMGPTTVRLHECATKMELLACTLSNVNGAVIIQLHLYRQSGIRKV